MVQGPEGANYNFGSKQMLKVEDILWEYVETGEIQRLMIRAPRGWGGSADYSGGIAIVILSDWSKRRSTETIIQELRKKLGQLAGVEPYSIVCGRASAVVAVNLSNLSSVDPTSKS